MSRITGPTHNLLGLRFGAAGGEVAVERLGPVTPEAPQLLDEVEVLREISLGVGDANVDLHVVGVRWVLDDSPPPRVYRMLARQLAEAAAARS